MAPRSDAYDVVVIGAGIGGVTAAALLARSGRKVLVAEQGDGPGGYVHSFHRAGYTIDPSVHGILDPALFDALLTHLGVRDACTLLPLETYCQVRFPGVRFQVPFGVEAVIDAHAAAVPESASEIRDFLEICERVHVEGHEASATVSLANLDEQAARFPTLFQYRKATLADVLDDMVADERARAVCASTSVLLGLPPSRISFTNVAQAMFTAAVNGVSYVEGGLQRLVDAFVAALSRDGGELLLGTAATRIVVSDGRAQRVVLSDGSEVRAGVVISNAAARQTFFELLGEETPVETRRRLERLTPSVSAFIVYAGTDFDLAGVDLDHLTFWFEAWDLEAVYQSCFRGEPSGLQVVIPTLVDPTVAPPNRHLLNAVNLVPYEAGASWRELKPTYLARMVDAMERLIPGIQARLELVDAATPETLVRFTRNTGGAVYGWEVSAQNVASRRPPLRTPIDGLYLAGHWTQPGAGFLRAVTSGVHAAEAVAADRLVGEAPVFHPPQIPPAPVAVRPASASRRTSTRADATTSDHHRLLES